jgi:hypothetical protein
VLCFCVVGARYFVWSAFNIRVCVYGCVCMSVCVSGWLRVYVSGRVRVGKIVYLSISRCVWVCVLVVCVGGCVCVLGCR